MTLSDIDHLAQSTQLIGNLRQFVLGVGGLLLLLSTQQFNLRMPLLQNSYQIQKSIVEVCTAQGVLFLGVSC